MDICPNTNGHHYLFQISRFYSCHVFVFLLGGETFHDLTAIWDVVRCVCPENSKRNPPCPHFIKNNSIHFSFCPPRPPFPQVSREQAKRLHHLRKIDERALQMASQGTLQQAIQAIMAVSFLPVPSIHWSECVLAKLFFFFSNNVPCYRFLRLFHREKLFRI